MDRASEKDSGRNDDATAAGRVTSLDRLANSFACIALATSRRAITGDVEVSRGKSRGLNTRQNLRHGIPADPLCVFLCCNPAGCAGYNYREAKQSDRRDVTPEYVPLNHLSHLKTSECFVRRFVVRAVRPTFPLRRQPQAPGRS